MRNWINLIETALNEKIVHRDTIKRNQTDYMNTVVAIDPTHSEFWSENFRMEENGFSDEPSAAGVLLKNGTIVVGTGHCLAHDDVCSLAGLDIEEEEFRLQIFHGAVRVEIWLNDGDYPTPEAKIAQAEKQTGLTIEQIKAKVAAKTSRFVPGWPVICMILPEDMEELEV
jgi:hypothetical protein